jgi:cytidylate kinase
MTETFGGTPGQGPLHGYRGEPAPAARRWPHGLTVAVSREAGARGGSIAGRVGRKLGWQVYDHDLLEYLTQDETAFQDLPADAREWVDLRLDQLLRARALSDDPAVVHLAKVVLALGAQGEVVLVGRGAGFILPPATTLHVRVVAPRTDRVAYLSQHLRLTQEEAAEEVQRRDARRAEFLLTHLHGRPQDPYPYDLLVNSSRLGEDPCAELIARAARIKLHGLDPAGEGG